MLHLKNLKLFGLKTLTLTYTFKNGIIQLVVCVSMCLCAFVCGRKGTRVFVQTKRTLFHTVYVMLVWLNLFFHVMNKHLQFILLKYSFCFYLHKNNMLKIAVFKCHSAASLGSVDIRYDA